MTVLSALIFVAPIFTNTVVDDPPIYNQSIARQSVSGAGSEGNNDSGVPSVSADGRFVAFMSDATNLVAGDTNGVRDIFVRDRFLNLTERVSVAGTSTQGNNSSSWPTISADGRFVAFESLATNFVANDQNGARDIFVYDRVLHAIERVSVPAAGGEGNGDSFLPRISADGRFVVYQSVASNLTAGDTNNKTDVFVRDRFLGTTVRASVANDGSESNGYSFRPEITADGTRVVFESDATNLAANDNNGHTDIFIRNLSNGTTSLISVAPDGAPGDGDSYDASITPDGNFVLFITNATNFNSAAPGVHVDVYLKNILTGALDRMNRGKDGSAANSDCFHGHLSDDARFISFSSFATNLVSEDQNGREDVFVYDRALQQTIRVSLAADGTQIDGFSNYARLSGDGSFIAFMSDATNLIATTHAGLVHIYGYDLTQGPPPAPKPFITVDLSVKHARAVNTTKPARDTFTAQGTFAMNQLSVDGKLNIGSDAIEIRVGSAADPFTYYIPANDPRWKQKPAGVWTFRSGPKTSPNVYLKIDLKKHSYVLRMLQFNWPTFSHTQLYFSLQIGDDFGMVNKSAVISKAQKLFAF